MTSSVTFRRFMAFLAFLVPAAGLGRLCSVAQDRRDGATSSEVIYRHYI